LTELWAILANKNRAYFSTGLQSGFQPHTAGFDGLTNKHIDISKGTGISAANTGVT
jgi:hypothetical protein